MYTFYFEVINTLWGAKFKLYATDSPLELGREFQQHEIEAVVKEGARVMLEPSKFVRREEPKLRVAPGYFEPKPITLESVSKFTDRVMKAVAEVDISSDTDGFAPDTDGFDWSTVTRIRKNS